MRASGSRSIRRSSSRFDLHAGIGRCRHLLKRFGGHRSAAGVTIAHDQVDAFARCFNEAARAELTLDDLVPERFELSGDAARGQSLVGWAIADGRRVAAGVDAWLRRAPMARAANG